MHVLRGSPGIIVLLFYFLCLWNQASGICPYQCLCVDDRLMVNCDGADLDVVPITLNPELKVLHLGNNSIFALKTSLANYKSLDYLDVSSNVIESLDSGNFNILHHLKVLKVNSNKISKIHNETFLGLTSLKELYLKKNLLETISSELFAYLKNLEFLDLSQNRIAVIHNEAFYGLDSLKSLIIRNNKLTNIPVASFQYLSKITSLDLGLNLFENIPENSFAFLKSLRELSLDSCGIHLIKDGAFKFLNYLEILRLYSNELHEIPTKTLYDVSQLKELHIGDNLFFSLRSKAFQRLQFLHTVNISDCQFLESIGKNAFSENPNLKRITLNFNKVLWYIHDGAFDNHINIEHVSLRGNAFETFQSSLFPWEKLQFFDVRDNPLACNCSLLWLWKLLMTKNSTVGDLSSTYQVQCQNPPEWRNIIISNLQESDLDCHALDARRQIVIVTILAGAIGSAAIVMVGFRYRDKIAGALKTKWGHGRKEPHYQKTSAEEESTILQAAHQSLKMTPVTEL